jgi:hypothetical protein
MTALATTSKIDGRTREARRRKQDAADREAITAALLESLGRTATMVDQIAAENLANLIVWARTLERRSQFAEAAKVRQQITQAVRATGMKPQPAASQKTNAANAGLDYIRNKYGAV